MRASALSTYTIAAEQFAMSDVIVKPDDVSAEQISSVSVPFVIDGAAFTVTTKSCAVPGQLVGVGPVGVTL